ncbi:MAG: Kelch domain protein [Polaromonas sp.]|nr:Kelch domain protein [Polaromonas sp.]
MQTPFTLIYRMLLRIAITLCVLTSPLIHAQTSPQTTGEWKNGPNFPFFPTHTHLLPNATVMIWPGDGVSGDDPRVWDPVTGAMSSVSRAGYDVFCSAHTYLPDGRMFVAGGHISNFVGLPDAAIFNPANNTWTRQPSMNMGRWYPTATSLPNGDVLIVSGSVDQSIGNNPLPQVWQSATGTWRDLTAAQLWLPMYPYMFLAPNGSIFYAGPEVTTRYLNTAGTGAWTDVANRVFNNYRDYGSAVMYEPGKILVAGGGDPPTNTAEVIDLNAATPKWRAVGAMTAARTMINTTMLPDGKVFAAGGTRGAGFNNGSPGMPVLTAEIWDPATEAWSLMATATVPRLYHSTALLLPDARVLLTGGNGYTQTEIFSPPYLFAGPRPTISSVPATVGKGQSFFVGTPDATGITGVTWIALPSVTHTNNMNQGFFRSASITQANGGINIVAPNNTTVPAGFYMLFLMKNGVPSSAKIIQLGTQSNTPLPSLASMAPSSATAGGTAFTLSVMGSNFVNASKVRWNGADRPTTFVSSTQLSAAIPAGDIAAAGTAQVSVFNPAPGGGTSPALAFSVNAPPPPPANNPAPVLSSIAPTSAAAGGAAFTLTATGTNFIASSKVRWNGAERPTTYVSATQLSAAIPASDLQAAGTAQVIVVTPTPGGGTSAQQTFTVTGAPAPVNPVPALASLVPTSTTAGGAGLTLTVNGSNFVTGSRVRWNGADRTTTFVSATRLTATLLATDTAAPGTAQVTVFNPTPGGGTSGAQAFTVAAAQNLTAQGTIIAKITAPQGGGARNLEVIRDGVTPPAGTNDSAVQYDTYDGPNTAPDDWIGYQFTSAQTFNRIVFQEGMHFFDGGWFNNLTVQVRQAGNWVNVQRLASTPAYPGTNNGTTFETFTLQFEATSGDAIRLFGAPGGSAAFISVAELQVYGDATASPPNNPAPTLASLAPTSATAGGAGLTLTVNGSNFVAGSQVRWNGTNRTTTFVSATRLTAAIPAADTAAPGTAQVTVFTPGPGGGTSAAQVFTVTATKNLTSFGTIIAKITAPQGFGARNPEVIRDGVMPPVGSTDSLAQYDTYDGPNTATNDWIGYQFASTQTFNRVVFQEGRHFGDGGWFNTLRVQVRRAGTWVNVQGQVSTPTYPGINNGTTFETYTLQFNAITGDGIRLFGTPGGSAAFISVAEMQVYAP